MVRVTLKHKRDTIESNASQLSVLLQVPDLQTMYY